MNLKEDKSLQDELCETLPHFGLDGWKVIWVPDEKQTLGGQVLAEEKTILIFEKVPGKARDSFLHEVLEVKLQKLIGNQIDTINGLIKIIQELNHVEKERTINELVPLIRHVFESKKEG